MEPTDIRQLWEAHQMSSREPLLVGFVDSLIRVAQASGRLHGERDGDGALIFWVNGHSPISITSRYAKAVLRPMLARIAIWAQKQGAEFQPYGGHSSVDVRADGVAYRMTVDTQNTPGNQWFRISACSHTDPTAE
jgi:hypothetical protein